MSLLFSNLRALRDPRRSGLGGLFLCRAACAPRADANRNPILLYYDTCSTFRGGEWCEELP
eukprot:scaffold12930_cov69-Phaeocystis_antarctica.AAC.1